MGIKVDRRAKSSGKLGRAKADREGLAISTRAVFAASACASGSGGRDWRVRRAFRWGVCLSMLLSGYRLNLIAFQLE
jgi:hypothetical protein